MLLESGKAKSKSEAAWIVARNHAAEGFSCDTLLGYFRIWQREQAHRLHDVTRGQLDTLACLTMQLMNEYKESEDATLQVIADDLWNAGMQISQAKVRLLEADKR